MDTPNSNGILGLFPAFEEFGGVQASGRVAWDGISSMWDSGAGGSVLFSYGGSGEAGGHKGDVLRATSRLTAARLALRVRWTAKIILIWHIDLVKLLPLLRAPKAKVILFLHGIEAWRRREFLLRILLKKVNLFLSNSEHTWQEFVTINPQYSEAPHLTVYLGNETPSRGATSAPASRPTALMLGRMLKTEDYKGHREMIETWPLVLRKLPEARLWIAGDGDLRGELEDLVCERRLEESVTFWGPVTEEKKLQLLAESRCLALPSRKEGFGLVYVEAMRMGRPCLVSTLDAGREVVKPPQAGLAADPSSPSELSAAVWRLLCDGPEWRTWSREARERYESYFTAKHFQERLVAALRNLD